MSYKPTEVNRRVIQKRYVCSVCKKSAERELAPGKITAFNNCTFTDRCKGTLTVDPNAVLSERSALTWVQRDKVVKSEFKSKKTITVRHDFGHIGSLVVELFVEAFDETGGSVLVKQSEYTIVNQTTTTVTIELPLVRNGLVIVTDNQFALPQTDSEAAAQRTWSILSAGGNSITIICNQNWNTVVDYPNGREITFNVKKYRDATVVSTPVLFYNNLMDDRAKMVGNIFRAVRIVYIHGKQYFVYNGEISSDLLSRGTMVEIVLPGDAIGFIPLTVADKTGINDIVRTHLFPLSNATLGNIVADGVQWIISDPLTVLPIDPPVILV